MNERLDRLASVLTPEQVRLQFQTAGVGSRAAAYLVDVTLLTLVNVTLFILASIVVSGNADGFLEEPSGYAFAIVLLGLFLLNTGYFTLMEYFNGGQTIGKRLMGLRVIRENGQSVTFLAVLIRNLFRIIDNLPFAYLLGSLVSFFHPQDKRIGDLVAGTLVVREGKSRVSAGNKRLAKEWDRWKTDHVTVNLDQEARDRMDHKDWLILSAFLERLPLLSEEKKRQLGFQMAVHFYEKGIGNNRTVAETKSIPFLLAVYEQVKDDWRV